MRTECRSVCRSWLLRCRTTACTESPRRTRRRVERLEARRCEHQEGKGIPRPGRCRRGCGGSVLRLPQRPCEERQADAGERDREHRGGGHRRGAGRARSAEGRPGMTALVELMDYDEVIEKYDPVLGLEVHVE